jgi:hypothetical protein
MFVTSFEVGYRCVIFQRDNRMIGRRAKDREIHD